MSLLRSETNFHSLSLRDLLAARDQYHWHLTNLPNVVGTAVGLYLFRKGDPWPNRDNPHGKREDDKTPERTLASSEVRPNSWPCVLVFVDEWHDAADFGRDLPPEAIVPPMLYMADGRTVPVCVVATTTAEPERDRTLSTVWPSARAGGGFSLEVTSQNVRRRASVGCLVSDGHTLYAMTNRHVCGPAGERVSARTRHGLVEIGSSSAAQITRRRFTEVYPTFAGTDSFLNLDAGLIAVDDAGDWTSSVYGLGPVGEVCDLNEANIGVQLVDRKVVAYGAASGNLTGRIKGLFYRYKSVGGFDYVADLMIAPELGAPSTQPGDSGTVWHLEGDGAFHPLALEWGAQTFVVAGDRQNFTLATNLSNVCKLLDVEVVVEHNTDARPFWGATGHYSIAAFAIGQVDDQLLAQFLTTNADFVSFERAMLVDGTAGDKAKQAHVVPLADVPDIVWKQAVSHPGGRDRGSDRPEHPTHYCDIDEPGQNGQTETLREICMANPARVEVEFWRQDYTERGHDEADQGGRGCLPFRVWQIYDAMAAFVAARDYASYLCAAGVLAHYVGDACQPLHGSYHADGFAEQATDHVTTGGHTVKVWPGKGVHSVYESKMIDRHARDLFAAIDAVLAQPGDPLAPIAEGHDAAVAIVALMDRTAATLPPDTIIDKYIALGQGSSRAVVDGLWDAFGQDTAVVMSDGIRVLAHIWTAAWRNGGGGAAAAGDLRELSDDEVIDHYLDRAFLPSLDLDHIGSALT
jgi:hypothetical protein